MSKMIIFGHFEATSDDDKSRTYWLIHVLHYEKGDQCF